MVATKHCSYGTCTSDSRYYHKTHMTNVKFFRFPDKNKFPEKCKRWAQLCGREDFSVKNVTRFMHICSKHFNGGTGPSEDYPDPIPASSSDFQKRKFLKPRRKLIRHSASSENDIDTTNASNHPKSYSKSSAPGSQQSLFDINCDEDPLQQTTCEISMNEKQCEDDASLRNSHQVLLNSSESDFSSSPGINDIFASPQKGHSLILQSAAKLSSHEIGMHSILEAMEDGWFVKCFNSDTITYSVIEDNIASKVVTLELETGLYTIEMYGKKIDTTSNCLPDFVATQSEITELLQKVKSFKICADIKPTIYHPTQEDFCTVVLVDRAKRCENCTKQHRNASKRDRRQQSKNQTEQRTDRKSRLNFKTIPRRELTAILRTQRYKLTLEKQKLKRIVTKFQKRLATGHKLTTDDNQLFSHLVKSNLSNTTCDNVLSLMISEQVKQSKRPKCGMRWHPEIVKWAAYLHQKSASAYDAINASGFLRLPSPSTLYRLSVNFKHDSGFHKHVLENMRQIADIDNVQPHQKYVALVVDEMNNRSDIVYNKFTGDLVGFSKLPDNAASTSSLMTKISENDVPSVAKNMLALFVRGLTSSFKYSFAHFPTNKLTGQDLLHIIWSAIQLLENAGFRVLVVVADGAAPNRNFFKLSTYQTKDQYKVMNIYALDEPRPLYFICDVPHLLKTTRNCLFHSNVMCKPRRMCINNKEMLWSHVSDVYYRSQQTSFRVAWRLTNDHVFLTPRSLMKVRLAAQVFSSRTAAAIEQIVGEKASETVKFIRLVNDWFDCLNVSNKFKGVRQRNNLLPYTSPTDPRLKWLPETFLGYLTSWKRQIDELNQFKPLEKKRMFMSQETYEGHVITVNSITEIIPFLLGKGAEYVLTSHFQQDILEQEFSKQRHCGGGNENPNIEQFGWNAKKINAARKYVGSKKTGNTIVQTD